MRPMHRRRALLLGLLVAACSPTEDWREVRPAASGAKALFPCKPVSHARPVLLGGAPVDMTLLACEAGGSTYGLMHGDVVDPARVSTALQALADAAAANLGAPGGAALPWHVEGMTPHPLAGRWRLSGRLPDGSTVDEHLVLFAKGTRVFQATVVGASPAVASADNFFENLSLAQ